MTDRAASRLAWIVATVGLVATVSLLVAWAATAAPDETIAAVLPAITLALALAAFVLAGAVIVASQPRNIVGWLLIIPGVAMPLSELASVWLQTLDPATVEVTPVLWLLVWFTNWSWILLIFPIFHLLLTLPTGRLLSARWRIVVALEVVMMATMVILTAFGSVLAVGGDFELWSITNPIGFIDESMWEQGFGDIWGAGLVVMTVASVAAFVVRFRRAGREERRQLKWPLLAVTCFGVVYGGVVPGVTSEVFDILFGPAIAAIPISIAIAVTRYRLYDINRIISRTIAYVLITAILFVVFAGVNLTLQTALGSLVRGNAVAVAVSTLVVAALFQPLRVRFQRVVDRRFNRARADHDEAIASLAASLRDEVDVDRVLEAIGHAVDQAVEPRSVTIWRRVPS